MNVFSRMHLLDPPDAQVRVERSGSTAIIANLAFGDRMVFTVSANYTRMAQYADELELTAERIRQAVIGDECPVCAGTGKEAGRACDACGGRGFHSPSEEVAADEKAPL